MRLLFWTTCIVNLSIIFICIIVMRGWAFPYGTRAIQILNLLLLFIIIYYVEDIKELEGLLFAKEVSLWLLLFMSVNLLHLEIKCTALSCSIFWLKIWPFIHVFWRKDVVAWQQHSRDSDWEEWHISCLFITWQLYNCLSLHPQGWTVRPGQQNQRAA